MLICVGHSDKDKYDILDSDDLKIESCTTDELWHANSLGIDIRGLTFEKGGHLGRRYQGLKRIRYDVVTDVYRLAMSGKSFFESDELFFTCVFESNQVAMKKMYIWYKGFGYVLKWKRSGSGSTAEVVILCNDELLGRGLAKLYSALKYFGLDENNNFCIGLTHDSYSTKAYHVRFDTSGNVYTLRGRLLDSVVGNPVSKMTFKRMIFSEAM